ncbi:MAG: glycerol-3-phosphate acyltransferase [Chloroflexi bacterium]|nr:glycerol-3-phosphate acyltransferase [Chloroflexota bacterium]
MSREDWLGLIISFLWGSIPVAYLVARAAAGVDIRMLGDGNVGARNVYLNVGRIPGILVALGDILKGYAAVFTARQLGLSENLVLACGGVAVLAHDFTPFLRFQGGQGMSTSIGVLFFVLPQETITVVFVSAFLLLLLRNWDLSMSLGFALFPLLAWMAGRPSKLILYTIALLPLIGIKKILDLPRRAAIGRGHS